MFDVAIIGGGVIGCLTARSLLRHKLRVCILEAHSQVGNETSKANSAIVHAGYDCIPGSNKAKFNVPGNKMMPQVCEELDVTFNPIGSFVLAFTEDEVKVLENMLERGITNGVPELSIISGKEAIAMEPALSKKVKAALLAKTAGVISSYSLARKACKNAVRNGAVLKTNYKVTAIQKEKDSFLIKTSGEEIRATYVINSAGVFADEIARMVGDNSFSILPRKGEYILYDKRLGQTVSHVIFQTPSKYGKGILVSPTAGGPLLIGPNAINIEDKYDTETTASGLDEIFEGARRSVPGISKREMITSFAGLRAISSTDDFIIGPSDSAANFINAAGIQSPGLTSAPAIADYVANLVCELHGGFPVNENFDPKNEKHFNILTLSPDQLQTLIDKNPAYGKIVCRCETITEAEIVDAIHSGAADLDSLKQETRAGMGRCQGGFCMPRVLEIIARETGIAYTEVTKNGDGSYILIRKTKADHESKSFSLEAHSTEGGSLK